MPGNVIEARDIVKKYNDKKVLDGVSFSVGEREFVTVYGKSGCGKTTLLNIIGGLDGLTSGDILVDGKSIVGLSEDALAKMRLSKIGFVFQDFNLILDMTVRENIALPARFSGKRNVSRVDELLKKFEISHIADETANKISGGEAQRAAIARALMNEPKIILADEPTGNLDAENTENVIRTFQLAMRDFGTTIVLATHDIDLASYSSTKITLNEGVASVETSGKL